MSNVKDYESTEIAYKNGYAQGKKDAEKAVVRCKDCANWDREWVPNMYTPADEVHFCHMIGICTVDDFFCAYGKRRAEDVQV